MDKLKKYIIEIPEKIKGLGFHFYHKYSLIGLAAAILVPMKLLLFYHLLGVSVNLVIVWLITCFFTLSLFHSFKNKWIPATIFLFVTVLMFADVTYSSFFNRNLSVAMLGAASVLGDIKESIKEVIRPSFYLLFADIVLIFATLIYSRWKAKIFKKDIQMNEKTKENDATKITGEDAKAKGSTEPNRKSPATEDKNNLVKKVKNWTLSHKSPVISFLLIVMLLFNITGSGLFTSITNQELFSYHIKDILKGITGHGQADDSGLSVFKDSYNNEKNGPLFGVAKDRNLIVIQVESFQNFVINRTYNGQEITPNLNALLKEQGTVYFDNYYQQIGSGNTSDAEFATNNSICGTLDSYTYKLFENNYFRGLPALLKEKGYNTAVFHAFWDTNFWNRANIYPHIGFDNFVGGQHGFNNNSFDLTKKMGWGLVDDQFFKQSIEHIKTMPQPFYSFLITLSNHHPFKMLDEYDFINLLPEDQGTTVGNYLNSVAYTDYALGQFIKELKEEGLYDKSVIALYGDHLGLTLNDQKIEKSMTRLLGKKYDFDTMMNIPLIITVPGLDKKINQTIHTVGGQLDFFPTIAYLMGFDKLDTIYLGHNLFTVKKGFVAEQTYMTKGSFFSGDIVYEMSRDGVFENGRAWNKKTGKPVSIKDCYENYERSNDIFNASEYILKNDLLRKIYQQGARKLI